MSESLNSTQETLEEAKGPILEKPTVPKRSRWERIQEALRLGAYKEIRRLEGLDEESRAPIFVLVGSMTDCTYKVALSYARGLAEKYVVASDAAWIRVKDDRINGRYLYEIHDGGLGFSILDTISDRLVAGEKFHIRLANSAYVTIEEDRGQVFSLISTMEDEVHPTVPEEQGGVTPVPISTLAGEKRMSELFPPRRELVVAGGSLLMLSLTALTISGGAYVATSSGILDASVFSVSHQNAAIQSIRDNPVINLSKAKLEAKNKGTYIKSLTKKDGQWRWEVAQP